MCASCRARPCWQFWWTWACLRRCGKGDIARQPRGVSTAGLRQYPSRRVAFRSETPMEQRAGIGRARAMRIIDVHSHWGTRRGYPLQTEEELAQQRATWNSEPRYHTEAEMAAYFRDSGVQGHPRSRLRQIPPARGDARAARLRLRDGGRAPRRHPRALDPHRSAARRPRRRQGAAALHRQADRLPRLRRLGVAVAAGERSRLRALLRSVHRGRHSRADLRRHDRARRGAARRRRRHPRPLPSASSRSGRGAQSRAQDRRGAARAGRGRPR